MYKVLVLLRALVTHKLRSSLQLFGMTSPQCPVNAFGITGDGGKELWGYFLPAWMYDNLLSLMINQCCHSLFDMALLMKKYIFQINLGDTECHLYRTDWLWREFWRNHGVSQIRIHKKMCLTITLYQSWFCQMWSKWDSRDYLMYYIKSQLWVWITLLIFFILANICKSVCGKS